MFFLFREDVLIFGFILICKSELFINFLIQILFLDNFVLVLPLELVGNVILYVILLLYFFFFLISKLLLLFASIIATFMFYCSRK